MKFARVSNAQDAIPVATKVAKVALVDLQFQLTALLPHMAILSHAGEGCTCGENEGPVKALRIGRTPKR